MINVMESKTGKIVDAIKEGKITISVIGLGRMGLSIACLFAEAGAKVIGVDTDQRIVELINNGKCPIEEVGLKSLIKKHFSKRFFATDKIDEAIPKSDILIIIVPTLIDERMRPDYSIIEKICKSIGFRLKIGSLVILESTVGPGITETLVKTTLENSSGLKAGIDFGLAYSPIRAAAGRVLKNIQKYPRIISGLDQKSLQVAIAVLGTIIKGKIIEASSLRIAEAAKLFENVYRDVNIALANELAIFSEKMGIAFDEARRIANTQPYSHLHMPGIGVGGHCIPVNPYFLIEEAEAVGAKLRLIKVSRSINDQMPSHVFRLITSVLRKCGKTLKRSRIAVLGISYKANVKEIRFSPSLQVVEMLVKRGARTSVYDPYFSSKEITGIGYNGSESIEKTIEGKDCLLIAVGHNKFKNLDLKRTKFLMRRPACIVDAALIINPTNARAEGFTYIGVGR